MPQAVEEFDEAPVTERVNPAFTHDLPERVLKLHSRIPSAAVSHTRAARHLTASDGRHTARILPQEAQAGSDGPSRVKEFTASHRQGDASVQMQRLLLIAVSSHHSLSAPASRLRSLCFLKQWWHSVPSLTQDPYRALPPGTWTLEKSASKEPDRYRWPLR